MENTFREAAQYSGGRMNLQERTRKRHKRILDMLVLRMDRDLYLKKQKERKALNRARWKALLTPEILREHGL